MTGYLPLAFIEEKVRDLENALFYSMSDAVLKIPTCVVKVLETDQLGQLWFIIPKPTQFLHTFERIFPVKLDFFRKGRDYYLKILGKAYIVYDPEEINSIDCLQEQIKEKARNNEAVILRVKITHADYAEKNPAKRSARMVVSQMKQMIHYWFLQTRPKSPAVFSRIPANHSIHSPAFYN